MLALLLMKIQLIHASDAKNLSVGESSSNTKKIISRENPYVLIPFSTIPFEPCRTNLYNKSDLYGEDFGVKDKTPLAYELTVDSIIYTDFVTKFPVPVDLALAQRLHDHSISVSLDKYLSQFEQRKVVGIMGGHSVAKRGTEHFSNTAKLAYRLANEGYVVITGGGPGAMEAAHLGTWFRGRPISELEQAIALLASVPDFTEDNPTSKTNWLGVAHKVMVDFPRKLENKDYTDVGIPTWFYGHEPSTPFASYIAKYFQNSVREEGILALARGGIVFAPGSAGTIQEIFQDAAQNYYAKSTNPRNNFASPMIFYGRNYWRNTRDGVPADYRTVGTDVYKTLEDLAKPYKTLVSITDNIDTIVANLKSFYTETPANPAN